METVLDIIFIFASTVLLSAVSIKMLHMYQLSSYRLHGVWNWLKLSHFDYLLRYFSYAFFAVGMTLLFNFCFPQDNVHWFSYLFFVFFGITFCVLAYRKGSRVPLAVTPRMRRLIMVNTVLCIALSVGGWGLSKTPMLEAGYALLPLFVPLICLASYGITYPFERMIAKSFIKDAIEEVEKLKSAGLKVVGITGSYGKTTAKNILFAMLSTKYRVCASPGSYNTPLGICRTVNDSLEPDDNILVAEMGARRRGDIKELCDVAKPDLGIITGVGSQHYETFGSLEAIADTKYELAEALPEGGLAVFNCADAGAAKLAERFGGRKALAGDCDGCTVKFSDVEFGSFGSRFALTAGGETVKVSTRLLGRHIPALIAACAAAALELGVPLCACARACEKLAPVPHRLELIAAGDKTVIDDAYNSNTEGAKNAVEVLGCFEGRKIIVTPGIVELGELEADANREFGRRIAAVCDLAILVGRRAKQIKAGAEEAGMPEENIKTVASLAEARELLAEESGKAAVLFENDLPDNY